jgi:uncharacterized membrane protein
MNAIHFHLIITHFPIICTLVAAILLVFGIVMQQVILRKAAYVIFALCALLAFAASASGEQTEILLQHDSRFATTQIEAHKKFAGTAFVWSVITGVLCLVTWYLDNKSKRFVQPLCIFIAIIALLNFGLYAWVGYQGGAIRHDEIHLQ